METNIRSEGNFGALGATTMVAHQIAKSLSDDKKRYLIALDSISDGIDFSSTQRAGATMDFVQSMNAALEK